MTNFEKVKITIFATIIAATVFLVLPAGASTGTATRNGHRLHHRRTAANRTRIQGVRCAAFG